MTVAQRVPVARVWLPTYICDICDEPANVVAQGHDASAWLVYCCGRVSVVTATQCGHSVSFHMEAST